MVHAAYIVIYNTANDDEIFIKELESDSLGWKVMQSPNKKTGIVLLASRALKVCGLYCG
jgi:hypothetical protein